MAMAFQGNILKSTGKNVMIFMVDAADHISGKSGLTLAVNMSKNGLSFLSASPVVVDRGNGWYSLGLTAVDTEIEGDLALHITSGSIADASDVLFRVYSPESYAQDIWEYRSRSLTYSPNNLLSISGSVAMSLVRGDTIEYVFDGIDLSDYESSYFTIKKNYKDTDCASIVQVHSGSGLIVLNGNRITGGATSGSLVANPTLGTITMTLSAPASKLLPYSTDSYYYDLQIITTASTVLTTHLGSVDIVRDVTTKIV